MTNINIQKFKQLVGELRTIVNSDDTWEVKWHKVFYDRLGKELCIAGNMVYSDKISSDKDELLSFYDDCKKKLEYLEEVE